MLKGLYKLTRINEFWGSAIMLSFLGLSIVSKYQQLSIKDIVLITSANLISFCFTFAINDVEDYVDDARDPRKVLRNPISAKLVSPKAAYVFSFLLFILSASLYLTCGKYSFVFGLLTLILGFLYSWKKIRLKSMPIIDLVSHALFLATLPFLAASTVNNTFGSVTIVIIVAVGLFIFSATEDLRNEFRDYQNDKEAGLKNTMQIFSLYNYQKYFQAFSFIPLLLLYIFMLVSAKDLSKILILMLTAAGIMHVYFFTKVHNSKLHEYPYMQLLFAALSALLLF